MTRNELELLNMIREHSEPDAALLIALDIILLYLEKNDECSSQ